MKIEDNIILAKLFDAYGPLLSEGQQKILSNYLNDDLTITEIAQNMGVSRQSVKDSVNKGAKKLYNLEEKLNFAKRIDMLERENSNLKKEIYLKKES